MTDASWNFSLLLLFALQHSGMARWRLSRRVYALSSLAILIGVWLLWRPMPDLLWTSPGWTRPVWWAGFVLLFAAAGSLNAAELIGFREPGPPVFREPGLYRYSRHPMYVGLLLLLWLRPSMTEGGLLLALVLSIYLAVGMEFEERKLVRELGEPYRDYQRRVRRLL